MPKKIIPLTDIQISSTKATDKQITLFDGNGLRVIITPKGRKYFRFDYTKPTGDKKRTSITVGDYGKKDEKDKITLEKARKKCNKLRAKLQKGIDPVEEKEAKLAKKLKKKDVKQTNKKLLFENISANYLEKEKYR